MHKIWQARFLGYQCQGDKHLFVGEIEEGDPCICGAALIGQNKEPFPANRIVGPEAGRCASCGKFLDDHELTGSRACH